MRKCLECGTGLDSDAAIIFHSCEAYPKPSKFGWMDVVPPTDQEEANK